MRRHDDLYPSVATLTDAKKAARIGAGGALFVALAYAGIGTYEFFNRALPDTQAQHATVLIATAISVSWSLAAWRVSTGKGFVSAIFLLIAYVAEMIWSFANGTANTTWFFVHLLVVFTLVTGVRGTWAYSKLSNPVSPPA